MAGTAENRLVTTVTDNTGQVLAVVADYTSALGTGNAAVDTEVTIAASTFQALTVPSGATRVRVRTNGAPSLVLKGVTGDTGVPITTAANPLSDDIYLTLGASPSIGILNNGASPATIRVIFM